MTTKLKITQLIKKQPYSYTQYSTFWCYTVVVINGTNFSHTISNLSILYLYSASPPIWSIDSTLLNRDELFEIKTFYFSFSINSSMLPSSVPTQLLTVLTLIKTENSDPVYRWTNYFKSTADINFRV